MTPKATIQRHRLLRKRLLIARDFIEELARLERSSTDGRWKEVGSDSYAILAIRKKARMVLDEMMAIK